MDQKAALHFTLDSSERALAADLPDVPDSLKKKLKSRTGAVTVADIATIAMALAKALLEGELPKRPKLHALSMTVMECLQDNIVPDARSSVTARLSEPTETVYQFKITLLGSEPPIWRRIQVQNCKLDTFHEHIQLAMGWTNSHLYLFETKYKRYGDPAMLQYGYDDLECNNSNKVDLGSILPRTDNPYVFYYDYDFGDEWRHEVLFEGRPSLEPAMEYPLCLEGDRACPPEDCGGVWGYYSILEALANRTRPDHKDRLEWRGRRFEPDKFNAEAATKLMRMGMERWSEMDLDEMDLDEME